MKRQLLLWQNNFIRILQLYLNHRLCCRLMARCPMQNAAGFALRHQRVILHYIFNKAKYFDATHIIYIISD